MNLYFSDLRLEKSVPTHFTGTWIQMDLFPFHIYFLVVLMYYFSVI